MALYRPLFSTKKDDASVDKIAELFVPPLLAFSLVSQAQLAFSKELKKIAKQFSPLLEDDSASSSAAWHAVMASVTTMAVGHEDMSNALSVITMPLQCV